MPKFTPQNTAVIDHIDFLDAGKVALLYHQYANPLAERYGEFIIANGFDPETFTWDYGTYLYDIDTANHHWYELTHHLYGTNTHVHTMLCGISCDDVDDWLESHIRDEITDELRQTAYTSVSKGSGNWIAESYADSLDAALNDLIVERS